MLRPAVISLLLLSAAMCTAQETGLIQGVISGGVTARTALIVQDHLHARPGVRVCRVDPVSRNIMLIVDERFRLEEEGLRHLLRIHGIGLHCYRRVNRTAAPFRLLDPADCGPQPLKQ